MDFFADYEPGRNSEGTESSHFGNFNFGVMFDLYNVHTHRNHPAKIVLGYNPWKDFYSSLGFTVFNIDNQANSTGFHTKLDFLPGYRADDHAPTRGRIQIGRKEQTPDRSGGLAVSIVDFATVIDYGSQTITLASNSNTYEDVETHNLLSRTPPTRIRQPFTQDFHAEISSGYEGKNHRSRGTSFFGTNPVNIFTQREDIGISQGETIWSLSRTILGELPLPPQPSAAMTDVDIMMVFEHTLPLFEDLVRNKFLFTPQFCGMKT